jgi:hypothetical protein
MASDALSCRACKKAVSGEGPRFLCQRCGYINIRFPDIRHRFSWLSPELSGASVEELFKKQLEQVITLLERDLIRASALLIELMTRRESLLADAAQRSMLQEGKAGIFNIGVQLVYLLLCERGGVRLASLERSKSETDELKALESAAFDAAFLATRWLRELAGDAVYTAGDKTFTEHFTDQGNLLIEIQENSFAVERTFRRPQDVFDESVLYEMQNAVLGFSVEDYIALTRDRFSNLRKLTTVQHRGPVFAAKLHATDAKAARLLDLVTLNQQRIQEFRFPYHFDLGTRKMGVHASPPAIETFALNWTAYYPAYEAHVDDLGLASLFTIYTFRNAFAYMSASRSLMAAELEKRAKRTNTPEATAVRGFQQKVAACLEERIEAVLRGQGFSTKANVKDVFGGADREIDVVGARNSRGVTEIVLIEAKDFDMPFHKPESLKIAVGDLSRAAERQLNPLTDWIKKEWRSLLESLAVEPRKRVVLSPLLITRRYLAPYLVPGVTVVPLRMLECVLTRINHRNLQPKDGLGMLPRTVIFPPEEVQGVMPPHDG